MALRESRVTVLGGGALGPLSVNDLKVLRAILEAASEADISEDKIDVIDRSTAYIESVIEENTTVPRF